MVREGNQGGHGTIALDLDGTLAIYDGFKGIDKIGEPIPSMVLRVKQWLRAGRKVVIFTSRASHGSDAIKYIDAWLRKVGIGPLEITNKKTPDMVVFYDDRAVRVESNTGRIL